MENNYLPIALLTAIQASGLLAIPSNVPEAIDLGSIFKDGLRSTLDLNQTSSAGQPIFHEFRKSSSPSLSIPKSMRWLKENRSKFRGQWVVLVGDTLIGAGDSPNEFVDRARLMGFRSPFISFIEEETIASISGWS